MTPVWIQFAMTLIVGLPALAVVLLALPSWFGVRFRENTIVVVLGAAFTGALLATLTVFVALLCGDAQAIETNLGAWFNVGHYEFEWRFVGDRLSLPFAGFSAMLIGLVGAFSRRYLHREEGFLRFFLMLAIFGTGVELVVLAGSIDLVFFGWELVGLTSALLIGFYHDRPKPVEHGLRAFVTYRLCDIGLLGAAVWLHHTVGHSALVADDPWLGFAAPPGVRDATLVGLLLLWASMGKSAQAPLGGWLPRAMEGPTNSSAIFYGAISIHLGPYLLLRSAPILESAPLVAYAVIAIGAATAIHATFVGNAQTDIKCALAYASMTQVGLIFVEIGLGFRYLALAHIIGHATLRSLQVLRSPSLLHDHQHLEQAMGGTLPRTGRHIERLVPKPLQPWLYRMALERGYFDTLLVDGVAGGFRRLVLGVDRADRRVSAWITGEDPAAHEPGEREGRDPDRRTGSSGEEGER